MKKKGALIFPGQGAQYPGMGKDFYHSFLAAKETFQEADEILGYKLSKLIFEGGADELEKTVYSQPAIYVASSAILRTLLSQWNGFSYAMCGGLSLGEYTALFAAGKFSFREGLKLVAKRGEAMQKACLKHPSTMLVVLDLELSKIEEVPGLYVANLNSPGQVVVGVALQDAQKVAERLKEKGARRVLPLKVAGAFHTHFMEEAKEALKGAIEETAFQQSSIDVVMNVTGTFAHSIGEMKKNLEDQVSSTTKWMDCVQAMKERPAEYFCEIGPGQLASMNRKIGVTAPTWKVEKIEDIENVYEAIMQ